MAATEWDYRIKQVEFARAIAEPRLAVAALDLFKGLIEEEEYHELVGQILRESKEAVNRIFPY